MAALNWLPETGRTDSKSPEAGKWDTWPTPQLPLRSGQVTSEAAARLPRQSLAQTRRDLVEAAIRIVNEYVNEGPRKGDPSVDLLPFLRLDEVLEGASELARDRLVAEARLRLDERLTPLTAGAFYKAFAAEYHDGGRGMAMTAFRRLVTHHMVDDPTLTNAEFYIDMGKQLAANGYSWSDLIRLGVAIEYRRWSETPALILMSALGLHAKDREVAQWMCATEKRQLGEIVRIYEELLPVYGRRMRPGVAVLDMATAVSDLIAGMVLGSRFTPEIRDKTLELDVDGSGIKQWHSCALAAWAIYGSYTEADD